VASVRGCGQSGSRRTESVRGAPRRTGRTRRPPCCRPCSSGSSAARAARAHASPLTKALRLSPLVLVAVLACVAGRDARLVTLASRRDAGGRGSGWTRPPRPSAYAPRRFRPSTCTSTGTWPGNTASIGQSWPRLGRSSQSWSARRAGGAERHQPGGARPDRPSFSPRRGPGSGWMPTVADSSTHTTRWTHHRDGGYLKASGAPQHWRRALYNYKPLDGVRSRGHGPGPPVAGSAPRS